MFNGTQPIVVDLVSRGVVTRIGGNTLGVCVRIPQEAVGSVKKYRATAPLEAMASYTVDYAGIQGHVYTLLLESGNYYVGWSSTVE